MEALNKSVRGECFPFDPSIRRTVRGTQGERKMYRATVYSALPLLLIWGFALAADSIPCGWDGQSERISFDQAK